MSIQKLSIATNRTKAQIFGDGLKLTERYKTPRALLPGVLFGMCVWRFLEFLVGGKAQGFPEGSAADDCNIVSLREVSIGAELY